MKNLFFLLLPLFVITSSCEKKEDSTEQYYTGSLVVTSTRDNYQGNLIDEVKVGLFDMTLYGYDSNSLRDKDAIAVGFLEGGETRFEHINPGNYFVTPMNPEGSSLRRKVVQITAGKTTTIILIQ